MTYFVGMAKSVPNPAAPSKGELRRAQILTAARRMLVDDGYDCFVMREIASRVGVQLGNLQYYYTNRDDLLEAVIRAEFERNQLEVAVLAIGERSPRKKLEAIARHLIEVWGKEGGRIYVVMSLLALHHPRFRALHLEIYSAFYDGLLPVLREFHPRARRTDLLSRARLITALIDGALAQVPNRPFLGRAIAAVRKIAEE